MRLTKQQQQAVREEVDRVFGNGTPVRLFGSRVDDYSRGGDIDLHIETAGTPSELLDAELRLQARLLRRLGERRIDVVVQASDAPPRPVDIHARQTGAPL